MKYFEFGKATGPLAVILHGGGTSYRGAEPTARLLGERFHVILAAYDGFNPSEPETVFKSVMDEARRIGDYIVEHYDGKIDVLYGISFGCRILMEVLKDERLQITTTIADGMSLRDYPNIKSKTGKDGACRAPAEKIPRKGDGKKPFRSGQGSVHKGDMEKLEEPGLLADRGKDRLFPV